MKRKRTSQVWKGLVGDLNARQSGLVLGTAAVATVAVAVATGRRRGIGRGAVAGTLALDLVGGLVAFQLEPTRRKYGASSRESRIGFALAHVQPFALPILGEGSWGRAAYRYAAAVLGTVSLERVEADPDRRRGLANALAAGLSAADLATDRSRQSWLGPVYLMKVIGGHGGVPL